jgi:ABC-type transport system involved in multi-copper enzyme maturation permease subunit
MLHLLRTEWLKIKNYPGFWWIMLVTVLSFPGINGMVYFIYKQETQNEKVAAKMLKMLIGNPFEFPEVFRTVAFTSSLFVVIPAILIIMLITNEYTYKTNRQNVIDGWSRNEFIIAKFLNVVIVSLIVIALYVLVTFTIGFITTDSVVADRFGLVHYIFYYSLQVFQQLSFAFLLGLLIKRAFIALGTFIFYKVIAENILSGLLLRYAKGAGRFLPTESSDGLTPIPAFIGKLNPEQYNKTLSMLNQQVLITAAYLVLFWVLVFWIYKKRDL